MKLIWYVSPLGGESVGKRKFEYVEVGKREIVELASNLGCFPEENGGGSEIKVDKVFRLYSIVSQNTTLIAWHLTYHVSHNCQN